MEICRICRNEYSKITESHTLTHGGMTLQEYRLWLPHNELNFYLIGQPVHWNYTAGQIIQGFQNNKKNILCMYNSNFARYVPRAEVLISLIPYAKALILVDESGRDGEQYYPYTDPFKNKIAYVDASLSFNPLIDIKTFPLFFKVENDRTFDIYSLPYCMERRYVANYAIKDVSVSCIFGPTNSLRAQVLNHIQDMKISDYFCGELYDVLKTDWNQTTGGRSNFLYYRMLGRSKMSISIDGGGNIARFFEILANRCLLISPKWKADILYPFIDGETYLEFSNIKEMDEKIRFYLGHPDTLNAVAIQGYNFASVYHTCESRATYMIDIIEKNFI